MRQPSSAAVGQDFWDELWESRPLVYDPESVGFKDLFERYLRPGGTCFEVGCYPGTYLIYLAKRFGYTVSGIDATPYVLSRLPYHLARHGVSVGRLYHGDFSAFETTETWDIVCSFGFVEHFRNFEDVIERHVKLVKPGGTLILTVPNFGGLQYIFHRLLDPANLRRHVIKAMDPRAWRKILLRNGMVPLQHGYYRTVDFWVEEKASARLLARPSVRQLQRMVRKFDSSFHWPNRLTSPHVVSFSRKRGS